MEGGGTAKAEAASRRFAGAGARRTEIAAVALACALLLPACGGHKRSKPSAPSSGVYHTVRAGETLYRIGKAYGVSYSRIAKANRLADASHIFVGQRLIIPGADRPVPVDAVAPRDVHPVPAPAPQEQPAAERPDRSFSWPIQAPIVTSAFGPRGRSFHDGIDIGADAGTAVLAAADGEVVYADELRGYGRVIILRHQGGYATVYAHNRENLVKEGDKVRCGQRIATVGESGRTTAPNLHFEVRRQNIAQDPLAYLPRVDLQTAAHR